MNSALFVMKKICNLKACFIMVVALSAAILFLNSPKVAADADAVDNIAPADNSSNVNGVGGGYNQHPWYAVGTGAFDGKYTWVKVYVPNNTSTHITIRQKCSLDVGSPQVDYYLSDLSEREDAGGNFGQPYIAPPKSDNGNCSNKPNLTFAKINSNVGITSTIIGHKKYRVFFLYAKIQADPGDNERSFRICASDSNGNCDNSSPVRIGASTPVGVPSAPDIVSKYFGIYQRDAPSIGGQEWDYRVQFAPSCEQNKTPKQEQITLYDSDVGVYSPQDLDVVLEKRHRDLSDNWSYVNNWTNWGGNKATVSHNFMADNAFIYRLSLKGINWRNTIQIKLPFDQIDALPTTQDNSADCNQLPDGGFRAVQCPNEDGVVVWAYDPDDGKTNGNDGKAVQVEVRWSGNPILGPTFANDQIPGYPEHDNHQFAGSDWSDFVDRHAGQTIDLYLWAKDNQDSNAGPNNDGWVRVGERLNWDVNCRGPNGSIKPPTCSPDPTVTVAANDPDYGRHQKGVNDGRAVRVKLYIKPQGNSGLGTEIKDYRTADGPPFANNNHPGDATYANYFTYDKDAPGFTEYADYINSHLGEKMTYTLQAEDKDTGAWEKAAQEDYTLNCGAATVECESMQTDPDPLTPGGPLNSVTVTLLLRGYPTPGGPGPGKTGVINISSNGTHNVTYSPSPTLISGEFTQTATVNLSTTLPPGPVFYTVTATYNDPQDPSNGPLPCGSISTSLKPYVKVVGGDVLAGKSPSQSSGNCDSNGSAGISSWNNEDASFSGAGTEFAARAATAIQDFVSGQAGLPGAPSGLSLSNTPGFPSGASGSQVYGGNFGNPTTGCPDFTSSLSIATTQPLSPLPVDVGSLRGPVVYNSSTKLRGTVSDGTNVIVYVRGDVYISSDIFYQNEASGWADVTHIPSLQVVALGGNIYIDGNVRELNGTYVAYPKADDTKGNIYTCSKDLPLPWHSVAIASGYTTGCGNQLDIFGAFVAKQVWLMRSFGDVGGQAAETFHYSPEVWLQETGGRRTNGGGTGPFQSITSLPPVI